MAEILGLASSIITVVGVAGKLGTSTVRLKRLWDEVQDVPASIQRCIEYLELLAPAIEEMDDEFQRTRTMVQNDSAAKRSLEYSRKAVSTLESLVRDMESQLTTAKKGRRLVAQLKARMKKEIIAEHQQQLQSVLQLVTLSQQTYLIALSRAQPQVIISEIMNWQNSNHRQVVSENTDDDDVPIDHEQTTGNVAQATYSYPGSRNLGASKYFIPWRNAGLFGRISYVSRESVDSISTSQLRVQPPNWLASKAWDLQVCRALAGWDIQMRTWITRPYDTDIFEWVMVGSTEQVVEAIMNKEASLYDRTPEGYSLSQLAMMFDHLDLLGRLISLGISLDDIDVKEAIFSLLQGPTSLHVIGRDFLNLIWIDHKEEILEHWTSGHSTVSKDARMASLCDWVGKHDTAKFIAITQVIEWDATNPEEALDTISRCTLSAHEIRKCRTLGYRLQDLAIEYFHEYLNCSPWMEEWRLITQTLFRNATREEIAALHIDQTVKEIWHWQFPLGPFEKWLKRGLEMLKEDLTKAGVDLNELTSSHGISRHQDQCGMTTIEAMQWVRILTGDRPWDPFVEGLAGEFWYTIETTQLPLPGSWVSDDEDDNSMFYCSFQSGDRGSSCFERHQKLYQGKERIGNNPLRVRGMTTCREMYLIMDLDGEEVWRVDN